MILAAFAIASGQAAWLQATIVTASVVVGKEKADLAPIGVALHGLAIAAGFLALLAALAEPPVFVAASGVLAAGSILVAAKGHKLRSLGNFTFIPALYLACETAEGAHRGALLGRGLAFLPYMAAAVAPVIVLAAMDHAGDRDPGTALFRHLGRVRRRAADHGATAPVVEAMIAVALAVACASALVEWRHLDHGQWVIWSAASVVTGDAASARRKLLDRLLGAAAGVPVGIALGLLMPHGGAVLMLANIGAVLTLVAFRRYLLGFGTRCALVALALVDAGQSTLHAAQRVENVVLGGVIGLAFVLGIRGLETLRQRWLRRAALGQRLRQPGRPVAPVARRRVGGDAGEQVADPGQLRLLLPGEGMLDRLHQPLVPARPVAVKQVPAGGRKPDPDLAAVLGVGRPADQALPLQVPQQGGHVRGAHALGLRELRRRHPVPRPVDRAQQQDSRPGAIVAPSLAAQAAGKAHEVDAEPRGVEPGRGHLPMWP